MRYRDASINFEIRRNFLTEFTSLVIEHRKQKHKMKELQAEITKLQDLILNCIEAGQSGTIIIPGSNKAIFISKPIEGAPTLSISDLILE